MTDLRSLYRPPAQRSLDKEIDHLDGHCRRFLSLCPLVVLGTTDGHGRVDTSPRGGPPGFVAVLDEHRLALGDLAGNNRLDSFTNVTASPGVSLLCLVPGLDETLRIVGTAEVSTDPDVLDGATVAGLRPRVALAVTVQTAYLHCAKALRRAQVWQPSTWPAADQLPDASCILADHIGGGIDPDEQRTYLEERYQATTWQVG